MTRNNKHIDDKEFLKYLNDKMTLEERNQFERELQKNPFEEEALEGFLKLKPDELQKDLIELKNKINQKKQKYKYRYWAAAATFLLIVSSGIIWFQFQQKSLTMEIAEFKTEQEQSDIEPIQNIRKEADTENATLQSIPPEKKKVTETIISEANNEINTPIEESESRQLAKEKVSIEKIIIENTVDDEINRKEREIDQEITNVRVLSQAKRTHVLPTAKNPERDISAPETNQERVLFNVLKSADERTDSSPVAALIGEPLLEKTTPKKMVDSKAQPEVGMKQFQEYLKNEAVLPKSYSKRKATVKLLLEINGNGEITEIKNQNNSDLNLFEQAKTIIESGAKWQAEIKNGVHIDSVVKLKIVFKRSN